MDGGNEQRVAIKFFFKADLSVTETQNHVLVILDHSPFYRVTVPYAACVQLYLSGDEHLRLEICRGE